MRVGQSIFAFTLAALLFYGVQAIADLPSRDPAVDYLRDKFAAAKAPTLNDLQVNKSWNCTELWAVAPCLVYSEVSRWDISNQFKFRSIDGLVSNDGADEAKTFVFSTGGLSSGYVSPLQANLTVIRVTPEGDLVGEVSTAEPFNHEDPLACQVVSLVKPNYFVSDYIICPSSGIAQNVHPK